MVKLQLPDFVKAIAQAFKQVVTERVMGAIAMGKDFAGALKGLASVSTAQPALAHARVSTPPRRTGPSR